MAANQQQIAALLKALMGKGIESKDAIPTIKKLVEAKIYALKDLNESNIPPTIDGTIQRKILPTKRASGGGDGNTAASGGAKRRKTGARPKQIVKPDVTSKPESILINRSPVLTLWGTIVAQSLYPKVTLTEALSLGSAVASQLSKAKGTSLGIYQDEDGKADGSKGNSHNDDQDGSLLEFHLLGFVVHGREGPDGLRAILNQVQEQDPYKTWDLLQKRFGDALGFVMDRMERAAELAGRDQLESSAYHYYMHIRPDIPEGTKGWGAHGRLYTDRLSSFYSTNEV